MDVETKNWKATMSKALRIWLLRSFSGKEYADANGYIGPDGYWLEHFVGKRMPENWQAPPLVNVSKSKKLGDAFGWVLQVPTVSARAREVFEPIVGSDVQFLHFHEVRGKPYYAMNVLRIEDFQDHERSEGRARPDGTKPLPSRYVFKGGGLPAELPPIFKTHPESNVFVTERIARAIVDNKLTGFCLQDPGEDAIRLMAKGLPLNAYPGIG